MNTLKWYVYIEDVNARKIKSYNIFDHYYFLKECKECYKNFKHNKEQFSEEIRKCLMYYFWSKCEWEIILSDWPPSKDFDDEKIDVYDQVMLNWDIFINWLWDNREILKKVKVE